MTATQAGVAAQIDAVRSAARDPGSAYPIRSRLRRALLGCARTVAEHQGLEKPILPGQWRVREEAAPEVVEVVTLCRRIHQRSQYLCQPSESFDVRWENGWRSLSADLDCLQLAVKALR